jgi:hypothetical protein
MPRNRHGWLKAAALKAGVPEQVARDVGSTRHTIELRWDRLTGGFATSYRIDDPADEEGWSVVTWQYGLDLPAAREKFKECERRIGA